MLRYRRCLASFAFLTVLAGCGGQSPSYTDEQIGENAKRVSYVTESADSDCVGGIFRDAKVSERILEAMEGASEIDPTTSESAAISEAMVRADAEC
jgi:hypothetical protein